jgi:hypothetical protein
VQGLQGHRRGVARVIAHLGFLAQLPFVHKYCESLLSCRIRVSKGKSHEAR